MAENLGERLADDDPEYLSDPADVDLDLAELQPADPKDVPPDEGDAGAAELPEGPG
jgi:hypothetical protein